MQAAHAAGQAGPGEERQREQKSGGKGSWRPSLQCGNEADYADGGQQHPLTLTPEISPAALPSSETQKGEP